MSSLGFGGRLSRFVRGGMGARIRELNEKGLLEQKKSAAQTMSDLHQEQWEDYKARFQPNDEQLLGMVNDPEHANKAIAKSRETVGLGFDTARGTMDRNMSRLGLSDTAETRMDRDGSSLLAERAAEVGAVNNTRLHAQDRQTGLMSGNFSAGLVKR